MTLPMDFGVAEEMALVEAKIRKSIVSEEPLLEDIARYEKEMLDFMRTRHAGVLEAIRTSGKLEEDTKKKLTAALDEFAKVFVPTKRADDQAA